MSTSSARAVHVLLVEDNPGDVELTRIAFKRGRHPVELSVVENGEQALDFVFRRGEYSDAARPDLVLLDLNLPGTDGREVLRQVKTDPVARVIPFIVLSTSDSPPDVNSAYQTHANAYMTKPPDMKALDELVARLENYWFTGVILPPPT